MNPRAEADDAGETVTGDIALRSLLDALADAADLLTAADPWQEPAEAVLGILGRATAAEHGALLELVSGEDELVAARRLEWWSGEATARLSYPTLAAADWQAAPLPFEPRSAEPADLPPPLADHLTSCGAQRLEVAPIQVRGRDWGFLALRHRRRTAPCGAAESRALAAVAKLLGGAIGHQEERQAQLAEADRFRGIVEGVQDCLVRFDLKGRVQWSNSAAKRLTGYEDQEIPSLTVERLVAPHDLPRVREMQRRKLAGESPSTVYEVELVARDGRSIPVELSSTLLGSVEQPVGFQAVVREITERRRLERRLRESEKMEAVGRLAGSIAHDFNNLLTIINGFTELVRADLPASHPRQAELTEIASASQRAARLTRQILAFSQQQPAKVETVDLSQAITEILGTLRQGLPATRRLDTHLATDLPVVRIDRQLLEESLLHLVANAGEAMEGPGEIVVCTRLAAESTYPNTVELLVSDDGAGMDAQTLSQAFEPFFTTRRRAGGAGLGLAMVYGMVRQHGGEVFAESSPGLGTTVLLRFPAASRPATDPPKATLAPLPRDDRQVSVLVVDDEPALRQLVCRILEGDGFLVETAADGEAALRLLRDGKRSFSMLLTDVVMPGLSGTELARQAITLQPTLTVLYMSGYSRSFEGSISARDLVDHPLIAKPFRPAELITRVRSLL